MEWDHFRQTLGQGQPDRIKLKLLLDKTAFIIDFLSRLLELCRQCQTHEEIVALYPQASQALTLASDHPYLAARPDIARLLVSCLLEYSKFQYAEEGNTLQQHGLSITWCIARLRRLINNSSTRGDSKEMIEQKVAKISQKLDDGLASGNLQMARIHELFDMALFLIHEQPIIPLIQKLTESAIRLHERNSRRRHWEALTPCSDNDDDDEEDGLFQNADDDDDDDDTMLLSPSFLNRLCEHDDMLWNLYCNWSRDLKFRLWKHHPEIIRAELMQVLHNYASQTTYVANADIDLYMIDSEVAAALAHEPAVSQAIFKIMTELLLEHGDWRIYRAWRHLVTATAHQFVPAGLEEIDKSDDIKTTLSNYIYGGSIHEIRLLRGQAWLWILVHPEWVFQWTQELVNQRYDRGSTHFWNKDEKSTGILCWLLYPSDDDRLTDTLESFRSWLQHTLQDAHSSATRMSDAFYGSLEEIFCGNVIVALCMTMSILVRLPAWSNQEYVNMLDSALSISRSETPRPCKSGYFLFLDMMPLWKKSFPSSTLQVLVDHVDTIVQ
ncbi:predicted protein [Lichtheimia corymbifera JMRC:FSU:9682]|uniref:Uncharacterized protein n=1 Tax=Lichtheimia corymbifera JMRC:FSU:9682 TaxID=1263082 RepID=A0A068S6G1_9FUNG|nr:predicted protein [Lichtheimia corymbifera JMRC:FSU:9682]